MALCDGGQHNNVTWFERLCFTYNPGVSVDTGGSILSNEVGDLYVCEAVCGCCCFAWGGLQLLRVVSRVSVAQVCVCLTCLFITCMSVSLVCLRHVFVCGQIAHSPHSGMSLEGNDVLVRYNVVHDTVQST